jgi:class 3 adenylate cyclase
VSLYAKENIKSLLLWLLLIVMAVFPALITTKFISDYKADLKDYNHENNIAKASVILSELQSQMTEKQALLKHLEKIKTICELSTGSENLNEKKTKTLSQILFKSIPDSSILLWLDSSARLIDAANVKSMHKAWESFARKVVIPDKVSKIESRIAENFIKSNLGQLLNSSLFSEVKGNFERIYFKSHKSYLSWISIETQTCKNPVGYLLMILPAHNTKPFWAESKALKNFADKKIRAGILSISKNKLIPNSAISIVELNRINQMNDKGTSFEYAEKLYYWSNHFKNPDLLACVAIDYTPSNLPLIVELIKVLIWIPTLIMLLAAIAASIGHKPELSIRQKFRYCTLVLTTIPVMIVVVLGLIQNSRIRIENERNYIQQLEARVQELEKSVARQTSDFENYLTVELPASLAHLDSGKKITEETYKKIKKYGCEVAAFFSIEGNIDLSIGVDKGLAHKRICYMLTLFENRLRDDGFPLDSFRKSFVRPALLNEFIVGRKGHASHEFFNRINKFDFGSIKQFFYGTYLYNPDGSIKGSLQLGFDIGKLNEHLLNNRLKNQTSTNMKTYLYSNSLKNANYLPVNSKLKNLIQISEATGNRFHSETKWKNNKYKLMVTPLADLEATAMAVLKTDSQSMAMTEIQSLSLLIMVLLASFSANLVFKEFNRRFLKPVTNLTKSVNKIRQGNYSDYLNWNTKDELGTLLQCYNQMLNGLKEKAEMKNYLSDKLISQAGENLEISAQKTTATVLFAGIRNFSQMEKKLSPEEAIELMNLFLSQCEEAIGKHSGEVDKFIGDSVMAFFSGSDQNEKNALETALEIKRRIFQKIASVPEHKKFSFGIGIASGELIAGHIGSLRKRLDYTLIGDPVNLAARLEKLASKNERPAILIDSETISATTGFTHLPVSIDAIKGKTKKVKVYALVQEEAV